MKSKWKSIPLYREIIQLKKVFKKLKEQSGGNDNKRIIQSKF